MPFRKIITTVLLFILVLLMGTCGYVIFEGRGFWESMYLTIITVTTVGYGDIVPNHPAGKVFTSFLAFTGVGFVLYSVGKITESMVEGGLKDILEKRKMSQHVARLKDHYIICGFGRIGQVICELLEENKRPFTVIENHPESIKNVRQKGYLILEGDASDDSVLLQAGIEKARGLIAVVGSDADNLYITLSSRGLNRNLFILARSSGAPGVDTKLMRAGASKVISPYYIGARRMAQLIVRPTVIDFIDLTMHAGELGLRLEELLVSEQATFAGKTLVNSGLRKKYDVIVVAIKRRQGKMLFNPRPETVIQPGDILVVLGEHDQIKAIERDLNS